MHTKQRSCKTIEVAQHLNGIGMNGIGMNGIGMNGIGNDGTKPQQENGSRSNGSCKRSTKELARVFFESILQVGRRGLSRESFMDGFQGEMYGMCNV